ncbi:MAG: hypothetical protein WA610_06435 [Thermodesulfovibrionales bacterium]
MKCPDCGMGVRPGEPCPKCGKKVAASDGMKVEYKDFKGAELLDIQMPGNRSHGPANEQPEAAQKKTMSSRPAALDRKNTPASKTLLILFAIVMAALAGYLLLKVFRWQ